MTWVQYVFGGLFVGFILFLIVLAVREARKEQAQKRGRAQPGGG